MLDDREGADVSVDALAKVSAAMAPRDLAQQLFDRVEEVRAHDGGRRPRARGYLHRLVLRPRSLACFPPITSEMNYGAEFISRLTREPQHQPQIVRIFPRSYSS